MIWETRLTGGVASAAVASGLLYLLYRCRPTRVSIADKCILVTGCDSGFGKMLATRARDAGFVVVAACYSKQGAEQYAAEENISTVVADLTTSDGRHKVVEATKQVAQRFDGLYAIVNNAGMVLGGNIIWLQPKVYEDHMNINFHAPVELTYELLPLIKKARGRVVNVTSVDGILSIPFNAGYNSSKHALEAYSDTLRVEMMPWDVKVVVVEPATMNTNMVMQYSHNYVKNFHRAPAERKAYYGEKWINKKHEINCEAIKHVAADPVECVEDLMDALTLGDPPARILSGSGAKYFYYPLSCLPDKLRDKLVYALMARTDVTPAGLMGSTKLK